MFPSEARAGGPWTSHVVWSLQQIITRAAMPEEVCWEDFYPWGRLDYIRNWKTTIRDENIT